MIQGLGRRIFKTIGTLVLLGRLRSLGSPLLFWSASKSVRTFIDLNSIFRRFLLGLPPGSPHSFSAISPAGCFFSGGFYVATFFPTIFFATIFFAITFCFWDSMSLKVMSG